jgi:hypothetical protein
VSLVIMGTPGVQLVDNQLTINGGDFFWPEWQTKVPAAE